MKYANSWDCQRLHILHKQGGKEDEKGRCKTGGTAAPEYKMPFGYAIKKSTHRCELKRETHFPNQ